MTSRDMYRKHADLMDRMASAVGLDLSEAAIEHRLVPDDLAAMVTSCTRCAQVEACETYLAQAGEMIRPAPAYCRNAGVFAELKDG